MAISMTTFLARTMLKARPHSFLHFMSLRTGAELTTLCLLLNKVSGVYGLLALLTGVHLSSLQLAMYLYSMVALGLVIALARHIRTQQPFECLALASFVVIDTVLNALWTVVFACSWFLTVSQHHQGLATGVGHSGHAGVVKPEQNVSHVEVVVGPDQGIPGHKSEAVTAGSPALGDTTSSTPSLSHGILQPESIPSLLVIVALWAIRTYLVLVVLAYARFVLQRYIACTMKASPSPVNSGITKDCPDHLDNPFTEQNPQGQGWRGRLGRVMVGIAPEYWLGIDEADSSMLSDEIALISIRRKEAAANEMPGVQERERRRRSGTGPPMLTTQPLAPHAHTLHFSPAETREPT